MWHLFRVSEGNAQQLKPDKISTKAQEAMIQIIEGAKVRKYWANHSIFPQEMESAINWESVKLAQEKRSFNLNRWSSKMAAGFIPSGLVMKDRGLWEGSVCPCNCGKELEVPEHMNNCKKAKGLWSQLTFILTEWVPKEDLAPGVITALATGLKQWKEDDGYKANHNWSAQIKDAFTQQTAIGWEAASKGMLLPECPLQKKAVQTSWHKGSHLNHQETLGCLLGSQATSKQGPA
eukprot:2929121-Ditylum_brightwellii.AAC.1